MARRALITGINGFVARHLADCLLERGVAVFGTHRGLHPPEGLPPAVHLLAADLEEPATLAQALREAGPDWLFHLAGISAEGEARRHPERAFAVNVLGTLHLLQALRSLGRTPRVLTTGSCAEYGAVHPEENPIREDQPLQPVSPYGVSKAAQGLLALQQHREYGVPVLHVRAFNHTGPGQRDEFAASSFAHQIAEVEAGLRPPVLEVGNLSAQRDLSDVRDVCRAYVALMEAGRPGRVYNVGSGQAVAIGDVLEQLLSLSAAPIQVISATERLRQVDVPLLTADTSKLRHDTGWETRISLAQTLGDLLESWRRQTSSL